MTCLVIGGGGFIGQWLTRRLADSGRVVRVLGRRAEAPATLDARAEYVGGDYGDAQLLKSLLAGVDEIIDLAYSTVPKSSFENPIFDIQTNLPQAVNLLHAAVEHRAVRKLVMVSSGGTVYGHAMATPITEQHATNPVSPYGITKLAIEKYGLMFHQLFDLPVVIVRPGNAYGEGQLPFRGQGFIATAAASILQGRALNVFGGDQVVRDYIHVDDIASGVVAALDAGRPGHCYNVGTGLGHSTNAVLAILMGLARASGHATEVMHAPARPFDVLVNVLDSSALERETGWRAGTGLDGGVERVWRSLTVDRQLPRADCSEGKTPNAG